MVADGLRLLGTRAGGATVVELDEHDEVQSVLEWAQELVRASNARVSRRGNARENRSL